MKNKSHVQFANAAEASFTMFCNDIAIGEDGWAMITRFGDYPSNALVPDEKGVVKKERAIQRVDKPGAEAMVSNFRSERKGIRKFIKGCNIYDGHPDAPGLEKFYKDKEPKGVFADLAVRADGLYGLPVFTNEGSDLVESKQRRAFSARIGDCEECEPVNGVPCYRPKALFSAGLTNKPHLPVHFFNSDGSLAEAPTNQNQTMKKKLIVMCGLLGIQFANDADDAATEAALDQVQAKVTEFSNAATEHAAKTKTIKEKLLGLCAAVGIQFANADGITDPTATLSQANDKVTALIVDRDAARTQFANERTSRIADELTGAIKIGKITEAEKTTWEGRLKVEAQFANELTALRGLTPKVKTTSITVTRGGKETQIDMSNTRERTQFVNEVLAEIATEQKLHPVKDSRSILNLAQSRHPALFENVPHVEIKLPGKRR